MRKMWTVYQVDFERVSQRNPANYGIILTALYLVVDRQSDFANTPVLRMFSNDSTDEFGRIYGMQQSDMTRKNR